MSNNLDSSVSEYLALLKKRCPKVCPSIFPSSYNPKSIDQLCSTSQQINELSTHFKLKAHSIDQHQEISCLTSLNFEKREVEISAIKVYIFF